MNLIRSAFCSVEELFIFRLFIRILCALYEVVMLFLMPDSGLWPVPGEADSFLW